MPAEKHTYCVGERVTLLRDCRIGDGVLLEKGRVCTVTAVRETGDVALDGHPRYHYPEFMRRAFPVAAATEPVAPLLEMDAVDWELAEEAAFAARAERDLSGNADYQRLRIYEDKIAAIVLPSAPDPAWAESLRQAIIEGAWRTNAAIFGDRWDAATAKARDFRRQYGEAFPVTRDQITALLAMDRRQDRQFLNAVTCIGMRHPQTNSYGVYQCTETIEIPLPKSAGRAAHARIDLLQDSITSLWHFGYSCGGPGYGSSGAACIGHSPYISRAAAILHACEHIAARVPVEARAVVAAIVAYGAGVEFSDV